MQYGRQRIVCTPQIANVLLELNNGGVDIAEYSKRISRDVAEFVEFLNDSGITKLAQIRDGKLVAAKYAENDETLYLGYGADKSRVVKSAVATEMLEREKKIMLALVFFSGEDDRK